MIFMATAAAGISGAALIFFLIYALLPTVFYKWVRRNDLESEDMMLTFDDGPDEIHTARLLDMLKENRVKATFFVMAKKAQDHPEIITRMAAEGHRIALHGVSHKNNWFRSPAAVNRELQEGKALLKKALPGEAVRPVDYYRPPYGNMNLALPYYVKKHKMKIILWTVMAQDWRRGVTAEEILTKLHKRSVEGSVICLHDSGMDTGGTAEGPEKTIEALSVFLSEKRLAGHRFLLPEEAKI